MARKALYANAAQMPRWALLFVASRQKSVSSSYGIRNLELGGFAVKDKELKRRGDEVIRNVPG